MKLSWIGCVRRRQKREGKKKKESIACKVTWTMATCKSVPLRPTAIEAAAMTAGPVRNLTAIAKAAMEFPHAMILGCKAINRPVITSKALRACPSPPPPPWCHLSDNFFFFDRRFIITTTTAHEHKLGKK